MCGFSWNDFVAIYDALLHSSCLCNIPHMQELPKLWERIFSEAVNVSGATSLHIQLLNSAIIYLSAEKYIASSVHSGLVCCKLYEVVKSLPWENLLRVVSYAPLLNKFLRRSLLKALAAIVHTFAAEGISSSAEQLFQLCRKDILVDYTTDLLNLLAYIVSYKIKPYYCDTSVQTSVEGPSGCKENITVNTLPVNDAYYLCCKAMSTNWQDFLKEVFDIQDSKIKNEKLLTVLLIWKNINEKCMTEDLRRIFLNPVYIVNFFDTASDVKPLVLKMYVEVMTQLCTTSSNCPLVVGSPLTNVPSSSVTLEFLLSLPVDSSQPSLCGSQAERAVDGLDSSSSKCDITTLRKIILIILKVLAVEENVVSIITTFCYVEQFLKEKMVYSSDIPVHTWVLDLFFDQDDLLLEAMISVLCIFLNVKTAQRHNDAITLEQTLNPHKLFREFVSRLGYSHHILLEFLMSNETCMLLFLTKYLRLVLADWENFVDSVCNSKSSERTDHEIEEIAKSCITLKHAEPFGIFQPNSRESRGTLVSYSSSSGEESGSESRSPEYHYRTFKSEHFNSRSDLKSIIFMVRDLKNIIEKLTDKHEFPYTAKPLTELIAQCVIMYNLNS